MRDPLGWGLPVLCVIRFKESSSNCHLTGHLSNFDDRSLCIQVTESTYGQNHTLKPQVPLSPADQGPPESF